MTLRKTEMSPLAFNAPQFHRHLAFHYFALKENNREKMRNVVFIIRTGMKTATWEFATGSLYGSWHGRRPAFKHFSEIEKLREIDEEKVELIRDVARILKRD